MTNSKLLNFLYTKWLIIVSWYESSVSSKVIKKIYTAISNTCSNSLFVKSFVKPNEIEGKKSLIYRIFYLPFAFLGLFASKPVKGIFDWFKKTALYKALYCFVNNLIAANTRFVGVLFASGIVVYMLAIRDFSSTLLIGALAFSLVLCIFNFSLLRALGYSVVKWFMKVFLSLEPTFDYYDEKELENKWRLPVAALAGVLLGFAAAYISPIIALGMVGALVVLYSPIIGVGITVFAIPFLPTMLCCGLALLCFFAVFVHKCASGDKAWKLDFVGFALILFMLIVFICSITSVARENSMNICLLYIGLMSFYFTIVNTVKTRKQLYSLLILFTISAFFVAAYGIIQYVFGLDMDKQVWVDEEMFTDIKMRAFSTLENPNVLGEYLLLAIPVGVAFMWSAKKFWTKFSYAGISAALLLCLVLTMSRGCWIGLILSVVIFITFVDGRYWSLGIVALFLLPMILPASVLNRFLSIGNLGDTSSSYRMYIWLGSIDMLKDFWLVGIGPGSQAYNLIYPRYSYPSIIAPHSHNVYLQQMVETGIVGLGALIFVLFAFFKCSAGKAHTLSKKNRDRVMLIAMCAGVAGFFLQGVFDYVFYNYRVFMMLWMYIAFASALCGVSTEKEAEND